MKVFTELISHKLPLQEDSPAADSHSSLTTLIHLLLLPLTDVILVSQIEMKALDELISHKLPRLHAHLEATMCDINIIATDWYAGEGGGIGDGA